LLIFTSEIIEGKASDESKLSDLSLFRGPSSKCC